MDPLSIALVTAGALISVPVVVGTTALGIVVAPVGLLVATFFL